MIKRYTMRGGSDDGCLLVYDVESPKGPWVRYDDHEQDLAAERASVAQLRGKLSRRDKTIEKLQNVVAGLEEKLTAATAALAAELERADVLAMELDHFRCEDALPDESWQESLDRALRDKRAALERAKQAEERLEGEENEHRAEVERLRGECKQWETSHKADGKAWDVVRAAMGEGADDEKWPPGVRLEHAVAALIDRLEDESGDLEARIAAAVEVLEKGKRGTDVWTLYDAMKEALAALRGEKGGE
jgi:DNA repair exonuclease SbcCD ATPase subunit